jgi:hypothetical protein
MRLLTKYATGWNILIPQALFLLANFVLVPAFHRSIWKKRPA